MFKDAFVNLDTRDIEAVGSTTLFGFHRDVPHAEEGSPNTSSGNLVEIVAKRR